MATLLFRFCGCGVYVNKIPVFVQPKPEKWLCHEQTRLISLTLSMMVPDFLNSSLGINKSRFRFSIAMTTKSLNWQSD